ncbi:MAG: suppressor of fused domain protein [Phycisphaeraceae bacterium]|nr:suppressor of fused domain protein [Phycisphaeraceae bacterium]
MAASENVDDNQSGSMEEICAHFESVYGESEIVLHEIVSDELHIDVFPIPPSEDSPCWTLHTTGMSERAMDVPPEMATEEVEVSGFQYAEMMIQLPPDWPVLEEDPEKAAKTYWPIGWLKRAARLPQEMDTWLGFGHTVQFSEPEEEIESGGFAGMLIMPGMGPEGFAEIEMSDGRVVNVLMIVPLYRDELDFAVEEGADALLEKMDAAELSPVVEVGRKSVLDR